MTDAVVLVLTFGPFSYQYSSLFLLYLFVGWITVLFHARKNFDQPTYEPDKIEPVSIMMPRFISSQNRYLGGFLIYLTSMTIVYLVLSLAGPTVVLPIIQAFEDPQSFTSTRDAPSQNVSVGPGEGTVASSSAGAEHSEQPSPQWPLFLALAIVGLAPSISGLKQPELVIRRFSHRFALIPAYFKYIAFQMQTSNFDYSSFQNFRYTAVGVSYRPDGTSEDNIDKNWRKLCIIYNRVRQLASGTHVTTSTQPVDQKTRSLLVDESQRFGAMLHDLDVKLSAQAANKPTEDELDALGTETDELLTRVYFLASCAITVSRVDDISLELRNMGFGPGKQDENIFSSIITIFGILFIALLMLYLIVGAVFPNASSVVMPPSFAFRLFTVAATVLPFGISTYTAVMLREQQVRRDAWRPRHQIGGTLISYFRTAVSSYAAATLVICALNLPFHLASLSDINMLLVFSLTHAIPPVAGGVLACIWLDRRAANWTTILLEMFITSTVLGLLAALSTFLFVSHLDVRIAPTPSVARMQIAFDAIVYIVSGISIGMLCSAIRSYREKVSPQFARALSLAWVTEKPLEGAKRTRETVAR